MDISFCSVVLASYKLLVAAGPRNRGYSGREKKAYTYLPSAPLLLANSRYILVKTARIELFLTYKKPCTTTLMES